LPRQGASSRENPHLAASAALLKTSWKINTGLLLPIRNTTKGLHVPSSYTCHQSQTLPYVIRTTNSRTQNRRSIRGLTTRTQNSHYTSDRWDYCSSIKRMYYLFLRTIHCPEPRHYTPYRRNVGYGGVSKSFLTES
jgi:hypothetical protein